MPPAFLPLDVVLSLICVMLAALAPLVDIGRISPMQAIRETSLLRSRRRIRLRRRRRREYDAARLLARRHIALYRSKRVGVTIVLALSLVIISGSCYVFETSNVPVDIQYDYTMSRLSGASTPFVDVDALWPGMNDSDIYDMRALPLVDGVYAEKCINATALVDDVTNYILDLEWSRFDISYLYDRSGQKHGAALALDMPYRIDENYQRQYDAMRSRLGIDAHMILMDIVAIDPELVKPLNDCVYQGTIDLDALNSGREVLLFAPEYINIYLEKQGDNGFSSTTNYDVAPVIQPELRLHNDMFSAGDELRLCYLFATDPLGDDVDIESLSGVERRDATTRIGAILGKCNSVVQSYPDCPFAITTHAGLAALGLDVADYTDIGITLSNCARPGHAGAARFRDRAHIPAVCRLFVLQRELQHARAGGQPAPADSVRLRADRHVLCDSGQHGQQRAHQQAALRPERYRHAARSRSAAAHDILLVQISAYIHAGLGYGVRYSAQSGHVCYTRRVDVGRAHDSQFDTQEHVAGAAPCAGVRRTAGADRHGLPVVQAARRHAHRHRRQHPRIVRRCAL